MARKLGRTAFPLGILALVAMNVGGIANAADMPRKAPILKAAPAPVPGWEFEFGARYFFSGGEYRKDLFDSPFTASQLNSRLTYNGAVGHAGELFGRADSPMGFFVKGYAGLGVQDGGNLKDEDFPPVTETYSSTDSPMRDGRLGYVSVDVGYTFWKSLTHRVGGFVGYHYFHEKYNGYGCTQTATSGLCVPAIATSVLLLSETASWHSLRIGLVGDMMLTDRLKLTAEGAFVPYTKLDAFDNHWLRPDINPLNESGHGYGFQLEGLLSYRLTNSWSIGAGGRYWYLKTTSAQTQGPGGDPPSPMSFWSERWGGFIQTSYKFGGAPGRVR